MIHSAVHKILSKWNQEAGEVQEPFTAEEVRILRSQHKRVIIILDDDPTGSQTVHDIMVVSTPDEMTLDKVLSSDISEFFILTNSRSMSAVQAAKNLSKLADSLYKLSEKYQKKILIISRGDSTLRSHFPLELKAFSPYLGDAVVTICIPAFFEGGRYTYGDQHYVARLENLVQADQTEFARDPDFYYPSSQLSEWISFKTKTEASKITALPLRELRVYSHTKLYEIIKNGNSYVIVNALHYADLYKVAGICHTLIMDGVSLQFQVAASFVRAFLGLEEKPFLQKHQLIKHENPSGLIIVGSHVQKTTQQLAILRYKTSLSLIEGKAPLLFENDPNYQESLTEQIDQYLQAGKSVIFSTPRQRLKVENSPNSAVGAAISSSLCRVVKRIESHPDFIIVKGGITSHDIATKALGVKTTSVIGQLLPGVPVWMIDYKEKIIPYIIFPGNVGDDNALYQAYKKLTDA